MVTMTGPESGRWIEAPILPALPPPPPERIVIRGARLVRVMTPQGGHTDAVILAWARLGSGAWGALAAWGGHWQQGGRTTVRARWGWVRLVAVQVRPVEPPRRRIEGAEWHGWHAESEFARAVREAALMLPADRRDAALTPRAS